jgi:hypothetical protein
MLCEIMWEAALKSSRYSNAREVWEEYQAFAEKNDWIVASFDKWLSEKDK